MVQLRRDYVSSECHLAGRNRRIVLLFSRSNDGIDNLKRPILRQKPKERLAKLLAGAGGLLAATVSLGYSLYEKRESEIVPQVEVSTPVGAGRWKMSVTAGSIVTVMPNGGKISPGKKAIALDMILENVSSESSNLYADLIKITNVSDAARPQYYLKRDRAILWDLHPRMPEAVTAVWEVSDSQTLPYSLQLRVEGAVFKPRDNLYAAPGWFPSGSVAEIRLPLANAGQGVLP
ncbi:hypothetical protein [Agrobacterium pusense]|uniref:hypothetical protein n=2 Tax=Pseudomonadota TaxID=1224 RepID=UPI00080F0659|nr:hypothetical protein [Agrobacterium pusense]ANV23753.1 hypothetical protein BA939_07235 [Rhizobium sp. S41]QWW77320.1 hypothetical protein KP800_19495 [Agrobacterium pusense]